MKTTTATLLSLAVPALVTATGEENVAARTLPIPSFLKPYVSSTLLQLLVTKKGLRDGAQKLQDIANKHGGNRAFGSGGHNATVDYIYDTLAKTGYYNVRKQPFTEVFSEGTGKLTVAGQDIESQIMTYTPGGGATASLIAVPNLGCTPADYPAAVAGNIALVSRGTCAFAEKSLSAKAAGAAGIVIYNNVPGSLSGTLGAPFADYAPVVGISQEDGTAILAQLSAGPVEATLDVKAITENRVNFNVIAETKDGDHNNVLVAGGHTDSVSAGPGINDDGSGTIGILTVAKHLTNFRVKNAVRFVFFGAEEFGLLGSYFYVKSINSSETELAKIRAYLNFDMIASPNYIYGIYDGDGSAFNLTGPTGSDTIEKDFEDFFKSKRTPSVPTEFSGRSDYAAFIQNGIPSGGLFTGAEVLKTEEEQKLFGGEAGVSYDINYHKAGDTIENLNWEAFVLNTKAIAHSVAKYAISWKGIPEVNLNTRRWDGDRAKKFKRDTHAHAHVHSGPCGGGDLI
ncbi:putative aminopeptidase [Podospora australis]|uniref:Peptide hydrolase n=1 Tax=Podospora australis TaxID=1536484 RepID=A0AAN7AEV4_9PEZI|nr:putative aminopeptidase [Podospora australis]